MKKTIVLEIIFPWVIIPWILNKYIDLSFVHAIQLDSAKLGIIATIYSLLIGFVMSTIAILTTKSRALVKISEAGKKWGIILYISLTLISFLGVLIAMVYTVPPEILKWLLIFSIAEFFQDCVLILSILEYNISEMRNEDTKEENMKKNLMEDIKRIIKLLERR